MGRRDLVLLALAGLALLVSLGFFLGAPRLEAVAPAEGEEVAVGWVEVRLTFSRPVRLKDVAARVAFDPAVPGTWRLEGEGRVAVFTPEAPWPPGTEVRARLRGGVRAAGWLPWPALGGRSWGFSVAPVQLAYLSPANDTADLYAFDPQSGGVVRLTNLQGVLDYAVGPRGRWIYLSVRNVHFGADLYALDRLNADLEPALLLSCLADICTAPRPAPDGHTLAFQRSNASGQRLRIWLLDLDTKEARPISPENHYAQDPRWSPDGKLAYYDATRQGYVVLDGADEEIAFFPSDTHEGYAWTADGQALLVVRLQPLPQVKGTHGEPLVTGHLWRFSLTSQVPLDLSRPAEVEDAAPAADPTGRWIAFARRYMDPDRWTLGRQAWLMTPVGGSPHPVTQSPDFQHQAFAWSPDGQQLAFVRTDQGNLGLPPEVWMYDLTENALARVAFQAYAPQWLP